MENMIWNKNKECMSREELRDLQGKRLHKLVDLVYHNTPFYRAKMQEMDLLPDDIRTIDDIVKLPFTTKADLRDNYPVGLLATPMSEIVRIHASSGTTGNPTIVGYTYRDLGVEVLSVATVEAVGDDPQRQVLDHHERVVGRDSGRDHGRVLVAADVVVVLEVGPAFVHTLHVAQLGGTLLGREVGSRTILACARVGSGLEVVVIATGGQTDEDHANGQEA